MAVSLNTITTKVRYLLGDNLVTSIDIFTYTTSNVFTLTEDAVSISTVYLNDAEMGDSESVLDTTTNKATVSLSLSSGDTVEIHYSSYINYSSTEIQNYIHAAIMHLSANTPDTYKIVNSSIYPEPKSKIQNLIAMITALLIEPDNKSYRLPDISINVPKDVPLHLKIRQTIAFFKRSGHGIFFIT